MRSLSIVAIVVAFQPAASAEEARGTRFLAFDLGAPWKPDRRKVVPLPDDAGFKLRQPVTFRGRRFTATLVAAEGRLASVRLKAATRGQAARKLTDWTETLCTSLGQPIERRSPSPLGTPKPGERWDPVTLTHGQCEGILQGVSLDVREEQSEAGDFRRAEVEITAEPPPAPEPKRPEIP